MRWFRFLSLVSLVLLSACADARSHADLMADAATDVEAVRLERAMARFDSARTVSPDDAETHRQYARLASFYDLYANATEAWERALEVEPGNGAAWDGYIRVLLAANRFEMDRRYGEKLLRVLPEALRSASRRPEIYANAMQTAEGLGELEAYRAILLEQHASGPDDQVLVHHLDAVRVMLADLKGGGRRSQGEGLARGGARGAGRAVP